MADYYTLLTNAGIAYETACKAAGVPIKLTQISVGDGGGAVYNPAATATALKREVWRGPLNALFQDEKNPSWLLAEVTIPPDVGGWYVREAGLWTDTGILYAIVKYPESFKPVLATSGSGKEFYIRSIFETSNASLVTLLIDDTVVKATRAWVMSYLAEELGKLDGKQSVRVAATANVVLNGAQQIDGVAVIAGDRVLLPNQTLAKDNGLWIVANGDWTRANDANVSAKVTPGLTVMVEEGTLNGDSLWHLTTNAPITLGTTALTFKMLAGRTGIAAGTYKSLSVDEYGRATAGSNPDTLAGFGIKDSYTKAEVEALIAKASALPVGSIVAFPVDTPPPGFLELDNSVRSSATYPDLSAYLGGKFNKGDEGVGNFRLPEARGEFLRGWDHGRGVDAGRASGSFQSDSLKAHYHFLPTGSGGGQVADPNGETPTVVLKDTAADWVLRTEGDNPDLSIGRVRTYNFGAATETRPRNIAVMWCIKAWNAPVNQGNIDVAALVKEVSRLGSAVPVGAVMAFPTGIVPPGFLELDGSVQSTATYPDLATYLGTTFNKGDEGVGNFRLPESRGEFLRGWDHGRGVDSGRNFGTYQADDFKAHNHPPANNRPGFMTNEFPTVQAYHAAASGGPQSYSGEGQQIATTGNRGGTETRPRNLAVMWCIKAWNAPINQGSIDVAALAKEVSQLKSSVPVGAVLSFPTGIVPAGYLELDGSVQSIAVYPDLAAYLGTTFNKGDEGAGNFRLPESRGEFLRGWDHGRGVDAGRTIGSWQKATLVAHDAVTSTAQAIQAAASSWKLNPDSSGKSHPVLGGDVAFAADYPAAFLSSGELTSPVSLNQAALFTEGHLVGTRPRNLAVMWCIKAWNAPVNQGSIDIAALAAAVQTTSSNGPIVGSLRGDKMQITVASSSGAIKVAGVVVGNSNGKTRTLRNFSQLIDLASATKGLGAMDVGSAPVNGYVALYAFYNPDTEAQGVMAWNCTSAVAPVMYGGSAPPAGYTYSALIGVWPTNASGQFPNGYQENRMFFGNSKEALSTQGGRSSYTPFSVASAVPMNAKQCQGFIGLSNASAGVNTYAALGGENGVGNVQFACNPSGAANGGPQSPFPLLPLTSPQTLYHTLSASAGIATFSINITAYKF
ncbi:phage tail protein [Pseudomonas sp. IzPS59]|uniref:phage tail protein n=1 Tax=Pseudomonas sp. IzPS59 TaxID=2774459 RepID=UPI001CE3C945|nr:phage tail protein [Pseudomonas sp. IzPS59]